MAARAKPAAARRAAQPAQRRAAVVLATCANAHARGGRPYCIMAEQACPVPEAGDPLAACRWFREAVWPALLAANRRPFEEKEGTGHVG